MKNLFGIVPGAIYGWPKNVLHWAGVSGSVIDINAALDVPRFNIVDGIVGMEGNGPIQGEPREVGVLVFGEDPVAVDATGARLMGLDPLRIDYLAETDRFLGNADGELVDTRGEPLARFAQDFRVLDAFEHLRIDSARGG
jgi:uncharacterized protein (DUF362 family)